VKKFLNKLVNYNIMNYREVMIEEVSIFLLRNNYAVKQCTRVFDIIANGKNTLLIKVLKDANSISEQTALRLKGTAYFLKAIPFIISSYAGSKLVDGVMYSRFGVNTVNFETFKQIISNGVVFLTSSRAGETLTVNSEVFKRKRRELNMSLKDVADYLGVSRKMVYDYEYGNSRITLQKAVKLYKLFGKSVFKPVVPSQFDNVDNLNTGKESVFSRKFKQLGFKAFDVNSDFDVIAKKNTDIILTEVGDRKHFNVVFVSKLLGLLSLVVFKKKKPRSVASIAMKDFFEIEKADELLNIVKSFGRR